jgi:site-specific DNA-methyltransferase (adenine-specific)
MQSGHFLVDLKIYRKRGLRTGMVTHGQQMGMFGDDESTNRVKRLAIPVVMTRPYYDHGGVQIYLGMAEEILPQIADECVKLILTDPPYESEAHTLGRRVKRQGGVVSAPIPFDPMDEILRGGISTELARVMDEGWCITFCQIEASHIWRKAYEAAGLTYKRTCLWIKPDGMPQYSGDRPGMGYETLVTMWKGKKRSKWNGGGRHGVFYCNKCETTRGSDRHPTEKPIPLLEDLISLFSNSFDLVLDPFMGTGSVLRAAKNLERRAIGIEMNERYCEIAAKRLQQEVLPLEQLARAIKG